MKQYTLSTKNKFISIRWLIGTLAICALIWIIIISSLHLYKPFDSEKFDKTTWFGYEKSIDVKRNKRGLMAEDVKKHILARNMNKQDVITFLGNPDKSYEDGSIEYYLGYWSGIRIDMDGLCVSFYKDNNVKNVSIVQH